jgi:glycosyltransferase involved in cell wall biosynthesis
MEVSATSPLLSICIATRNRGDVLALTLDALLAQAGAEVEIVIVDGASTDNTAEVVQVRADRYPVLKYFPQVINSGVDGDFDKAVVLACGKYCWLMTDDDLPVEGAIQRILAACRDDFAAVIIDAEVYSADYSIKLFDRRMRFNGERRYAQGEMARLLADCGDCLSFIGALIIRREIWLSRERQAYIGTEFIHVGVMFQAPLPGEVLALGEPLLRLRYGVGNWTKRAFEVWMLKWPNLIWSFTYIPEQARASVTARHPWRSLRNLLLYRAKGSYSLSTFRSLVAPLKCSSVYKFPALLAAIFPGYLTYFFVKWATLLWPQRFQGTRWELGFSPYARRK